MGNTDSHLHAEHSYSLPRINLEEMATSCCVQLSVSDPKRGPVFSQVWLWPFLAQRPGNQTAIYVLISQFIGSDQTLT